MNTLVTAKDLSRRLAVSQKTIFRLAENGEIPSVRIGRRSVRFDLDAVARALKIENGEVKT